MLVVVHVPGFNLLLSCKQGVSYSGATIFMCLLFFVGSCFLSPDDTVDRKGVAARAGGEGKHTIGRGWFLVDWQAKLSPLC